MKLLFVYFQRNENSRAEYERIVASAPEGMSIKPFGLRCPRLRWDDLDLYWRTGQRALMEAYEALHEAASDCDVMLHYNGWSLHPEFIKQLPTFNVYSFFDDPESSEKQSRYVAPSFDAVMYGNIASKTQYASWGCQRIAHLPIFFDPASVPGLEESESILESTRDVDIVLCCGQTPWRKRRLAGLMEAFPAARVHGRGWEAGFISNEGMLDLYCRSKIGWNIHNSTGPINQRLLMLPAWGIMQICDNKTGLGQLYELDREAAGFDTIPEAIELTKHYLAHDEERRQIARASHERFHRDYHPRKIWGGIERQLRAWREDKNVRQATPDIKLPKTHAPLTSISRTARRWLAKQQSSMTRSLQRIRYGQAADDLDESIYLGLHKKYQTGQPVHSAKLNNEHRSPDLEKNPHHIEAMCWAITGLIGPAITILVEGPHGSTFASLARTDSARSVNVIEAPDAVGPDPELPHDLSVCTEVRFDPDSFEATLLKVARIADRAIFCFRGRDAGETPDCDMVYSLLSGHAERVAMSFMPDPFVPWLEPLAGDAKVSPLIAECVFHREDV